jgi:hypothetical protein
MKTINAGVQRPVTAVDARADRISKKRQKISNNNVAFYIFIKKQDNKKFLKGAKRCHLYIDQTLQPQR